MVTYFIGFRIHLTDFDRYIPDIYTPINVNQRHLTLIYLGDINTHILKKVISEFESCAKTITPFTICFHRMEFFPSTSRPKYLAIIPRNEDIAKLRKVREHILASSENIRKISKTCDKYQEFKPHVAIAYTKLKPHEINFKLLNKIVRKVKLNVKYSIRRITLFKAEEGRIQILVEKALAQSRPSIHHSFS